MSLLARPSVVFAIVFGCFAVLIPRVFLPLFRSRQSAPVHHPHEHFRTPLPTSSPTPPSSISDNDKDNEDGYEHTLDSLSRMRKRHHSGVDNQPETTINQIGSKSAVRFALPMYTVGIAVFFLYTCFKYWAKRNTEESRIKSRYSSNDIQWNAQKRKFNYNINQQHDKTDEIDDEDLYNGLDPDYVEYLRLKKQKEVKNEEKLTREQKLMDHTLDEMKHSLSFISSKLGTNQTGNNLTTNEIFQLQDRLASTEAQMCKIMNALDAASNQVNKLTQNTRQTLEQVSQKKYVEDEDEEHRHLSSRSQSESEEDDENSNSEENSLVSDEQRNENEEESSSSYEDDDIIPNEENESESESESSERYGLMTTNYECDPSVIDDYELNTIKNSTETTDSQTKVHEWHQRNHSQSLSSDSSAEHDQTIPNQEQDMNQN
ncbi:hypothetical protein I4U23_028309 [Adineta vaga]|nr:hypothetical protein I4U23_028309 [Adineta vaga]